MAGAKSLSIVVLCFLLLIAMSQAAVEEEKMMMKKEPSLNVRALPLCEDNPCFHVCLLPRPELCARACHCRLRSFLPNELGRKVMMTEALAAAEMEVEYNRAEAVLEEMMREELIRMNHKSTPISINGPCYTACRRYGYSESYCAKKCA